MGTNDDDTEPRPAAGRPRKLNRRAFLQRGALSAAAVGMIGSVPGLSGLMISGESEAPAIESDVADVEGDSGVLSEPLVAHVKDLGTGEISLFQGEQEVLIRDPALARRLLSAVNP